MISTLRPAAHERPASDRRGLRIALLASLTLHLLALLALALVDGPTAPSRQAPETLRFELVAAPDVEPEFEPEPEPEPESEPERAAEPPERPEPPIASVADPTPQESISESADPPPDLTEPSAQEPTEAAAVAPGLRSRLLEQLETTRPALSLPAPASEAERLQGRPAPRLPSERGWLSEHVGTVAAQVDSWQEPDGTERAQVTLPDGSVVCMERRAPSFEEIMQPWKSTVVTMSRLCGRARPPPVNYDDLRVRPPPGGGRRP